MPQELLSFPPTYLFIGVYRLITDSKLWSPIWSNCQSSIKSTLIFSSLISTISYPITKIWVKFFMKQTLMMNRYHEESRFLGIPIMTLATISIVASQFGWMIEYSLKRKLKQARAQVYKMTIESRGKDNRFWSRYVEEWEVPPIEKAQKRIKKRKWYNTISGPFFRFLVIKRGFISYFSFISISLINSIIVSKRFWCGFVFVLFCFESLVLLMPLHFVPFLNTIISSFLTSITLSETLLNPYFESKQMNELQRSIFITERENELRLLGFIASILESLPLIGLGFSISNRVGFAMFAHDLQKRQDRFRMGELKPSGRYESKTQAIELDLPSDAIGNFPKKVFTHIEKSEKDQWSSMVDFEIRWLFFFGLVV